MEKQQVKSTYERYCNKYSDSFDDGFKCAIKDVKKIIKKQYQDWLNFVGYDWSIEILNKIKKL